MHGHTARDADPERRDLAIGSAAPVAPQPGSAPTVDPPGRHAERCAHADHGVLEQADIAHDVDRLVEGDDRIADELTGAVPGDLAAAVDIDDRCAGIADRPVERAGALTRRVDGLVLKQQAGVRNLAGDALLVHLALHLPGLAVADGVGGHSQLGEY